MGVRRTGRGVVEVDERWFPEWLEYGFGEIAVFLEKRALFDEYCRCRDEGEE